jgi:predicted MFS family arabinose efflux permease
MATGWSRADIQFAIAFSSGIGGLTAPLTGWMIDRFGARLVALPAFIGVAIGMLLAAQASSLTVFYMGFAVAAILGAGTNPVLWSQVVASSFDQARGTALGLALVGTALAALGLPLLVTALAGSVGWSGALTVIGLIPVAISLPVAWFWLRAGSRAAAAQKAASAKTVGEPAAVGLTLRQAASGYRFWVLMGSILAGYLAVSGVLAGLVPALTDRGINATLAAAFAGIIGVAMIPGRVLIGFIIDRIWAPAVGCLILVLPAIGCLALQSTNDPIVLFIACGLLGLAAGAELDLLAFLTSRYFGLAHFSKIYAVIYSALAAGSALAPGFFSMFRESTGSYDLSFQIAGGLFLLAGALLPMLGTYPSFAHDEQTPSA